LQKKQSQSQAGISKDSENFFGLLYPLASKGSLSQIAMRKMQVTIEMQAYVHQWKALEAFLKALQ
jgi:hypothetical protein